MSGASKILIGSGGVDLPSDDEFDNVSFLSHFDGSNNGTNIVYDDGSDSNHTITTVGTPSQGTSGPFARVDGEWSNYFDGDGDDLDIASSSDFAYGTADFTWECFFFLDKSIASVGHSNYIIDQGTTYDPSLSIQSDGHLNWKDHSPGVDVEIDIATNVTQNEWHHVAISRASGTVSLYYDGTRTGTTTTSSNFSSSAAVRIGNWNGNDYEFNGYISNVRIVTGTAVYSGTSITVPTSALTAITNTKLLTCQSNRFIDNSASDHAMPAGGVRQVSAFTPFLTSKAYDSAVNGASAYFNGSSDYLTLASSADFGMGTGNFTWEGWFYQTYRPGSPWQQLFSTDNYSTGNNISIWLTNSGTVAIYYTNGGADNFTTTSSFPINAWAHIAVVRKGTGTNEFSIYINGTAGITGTMTTDFPDDGIYIGRHPTSDANYYYGYISDFRIVKGTAVYTGNFTPPTAPLTAVTNTKLLLNMADGQALDSAAQNNITLYGTADTSTTQQKFGTASLFLEGDSDTDFAQIRDATDLTGPFTIECWARAADTGNAWLWCNGQYTIELGINGNSVEFYSAASSGSFFTGGEFTVNTWHHLALVRDSSNVIKCYLNGTASGTTFTNGTDFVATSGIFIIGGEWRSATQIYHGWDGYVDDFRISRFARYTSNFTPSTEAFPDKGQ